MKINNFNQIDPIIFCVQGCTLDELKKFANAKKAKYIIFSCYDAKYPHESSQFYMTAKDFKNFNREPVFSKEHFDCKIANIYIYRKSDLLEQIKNKESELNKVYNLAKKLILFEKGELKNHPDENIGVAFKNMWVSLNPNMTKIEPF